MIFLKYLIFLIFLLISTGLHANFSILHYNIKELSSPKIKARDNQLKYAIQVIKKFNFNILSINEIQFDLPDVPNQSFKSTGKNLDKIKKGLLLNTWNHSFSPANTGNNALKKDDGTYYLSPSEPGSFNFADQLNFGVFPAEYSTGSIFEYKKIKENIFTKLKWKTFNPGRSIKQFKDGKGNPIPESIELFDKNFSDILLNIDGRKVHLILLHTVPSFHFGNPDSMNYARNEDQLRFLEWYLTGETDIQVPKIDGISPLTKDDLFITAGDFNANIRGDEYGSLVLQRLFSKINLWDHNATYTNESSGFGPKPMKLMLDYIGHSDGIELVNARTFTPSPQREELGCNETWSQVKNNIEKKKLVSYKKNDQTCYAYVSNEYYLAKMASDHFPIWAEFKFIQR